jgi:NADPH:quinone reductase-like Zn-dependent oxidoreductase
LIFQIVNPSFVVSEKGKSIVTEVAKPTYGPDEILVQVKVAGVNPTGNM